MTRTPEQNIQLHTLLTRLGIDLEGKEDLVSQYTQGRTTSSREMNVEECQALINELNRHTAPDLLDTKRKRVIAHLAEAGYLTPEGKPDMVGIYGWVRRQKYKLEFNSLNSYQLSELIHAADRVRTHFLKTRDAARQ